MFVRCGAYPFKVFFSGAVWKKRAPSIRFSRMYYVPFLHTLTLSLSTISFSSLCLYFAGAAVICCDKAASTGDARVSRVEGHPPPFPTRALSSPESRPSRSRLVGGAYDIFVIMLPAIRALPLQLPLVTNGREPFFFHFMAVYVLAHSPTTLRELALLACVHSARNLKCSGSQIICICTTIWISMRVVIETNSFLHYTRVSYYKTPQILLKKNQT